MRGSPHESNKQGEVGLYNLQDNVSSQARIRRWCPPDSPGGRAPHFLSAMPQATSLLRPSSPLQPLLGEGRSEGGGGCSWEGASSAQGWGRGSAECHLADRAPGPCLLKRRATLDELDASLSPLSNGPAGPCTRSAVHSQRSAAAGLEGSGAGVGALRTAGGVRGSRHEGHKV